MKRLAALFGLVALLAAAHARADTVNLRTSCTGIPSPCFTTIDAVLQEVHLPTSPRALPSASNPVLVDIGPGVFALTSLTYKYCQPVGGTNLSNLAFRGSGKENTILAGGGFPTSGFKANYRGQSFAVWIENCSDVSVENLTIRATPPTAWSGVMFEGNGGVRWSNVRITASGLAYYDENATSRATSVHFWFDSELFAQTVSGNPTGYTVAFYSVGSTHWVHGGQIVGSGPASGNFAFGLIAAGDFDIHVYGSRISTTSKSGNVAALATSDDQNHSPATQHCDTSAVSVEGSAITTATTISTSIANGVQSGCGAILIRGTRYALSGPTQVRVSAGGDLPQSVDAPYELAADVNPPSSVTSAWNVFDGQDTFIETDCSATKCLDTSQGDKQHLLTFKASCNTAGPWFDTTTQNCRGI